MISWTWYGYSHVCGQRYRGYSAVLLCRLSRYQCQLSIATAFIDFKRVDVKLREKIFIM